MTTLTAIPRDWSMGAIPRPWSLESAPRSWSLSYQKDTAMSGTYMPGSWGCQPAVCQPCVPCCQGPLVKQSTEQMVQCYDWRGALQCLDGTRLMSMTAAVFDENGDPVPITDPNPLAVALNGGNPWIVLARDQLLSKVVLVAGTDDTEYRVVYTATFRDCDGLETVLTACVRIQIRDC